MPEIGDIWKVSLFYLKHLGEVKITA